MRDLFLERRVKKEIFSRQSNYEQVMQIPVDINSHVILLEKIFLHIYC